jgi:2-amino-4-hydroxy-6-hydroxymethyldihydropteridine diphosphokinase
MSSQNKLYLLLGANLGDRADTFTAARRQIAARVGLIVRASSLYETAPWGVLDQPSFLNQVLEVGTPLSSGAVLTEILSIEAELGRLRHKRWEARLIDIDVLYYNGLIVHTENLTIPHPRLHERRFTLAPLAEIAPSFIHPLLKKTSEELLLDCPDDSSVTIFS